MPKVTVCLPTYNRLEMLKESVKSILATELNIELIILNNGCSDGTREYLSSLTDTRLTILECDNNTLNPWMNIASIARGDYIVLWSDDDIMMPGGLEAKVAMLDQNPGLGLVFSRVRGVNAAGEDLGLLEMGHIADEDMTTGALSFRKIVLADYIPLLTVVMRRSVFAPIFAEALNNPAWPPMDDWPIWIEAAHRGVNAGYISCPTAYYRTHQGSVTSQLMTSNSYMRCHMNVWKYWAERGYTPNPSELYRLQGLLLALAKSCGSPYLPAVQELTGYWRK